MHLVTFATLSNRPVLNNKGFDIAGALVGILSRSGIGGLIGKAGDLMS